jgi:CRP-like cAMP-binding protein
MEKGRRSSEQTDIVLKWLMSSWKIAFTMGYKRCGDMLRSFEYVVYQPGDYIIKEGERGLSFYIIISGDTEVHKDGIGVVGHLGKGKGFGEIALTQGNDLRTATVLATTVVECVRLFKENFDYYVRDIQDTEKRETFETLTKCALFKTWTKNRIEKMSHSCVRHIYDTDEVVFNQGEESSDVCIIVEGNVKIVKELLLVCKNRWPVGLNAWEERTKRIRKPILLKTLGEADFFGEAGVINSLPRSTSAVTCNRCVMLKLGRREFLHLTTFAAASDASSVEEEQKLRSIMSRYLDDNDVLDSVDYIFGGPQSQAIIGGQHVFKHSLPKKKRFAEDAGRPNVKMRGARPSTSGSAATATATTTSTATSTEALSVAVVANKGSVGEGLRRGVVLRRIEHHDHQQEGGGGQKVNAALMEPL